MTARAIGGGCLLAVLLSCGSPPPKDARSPSQMEAKVLIAGSPIQGANGMAFDPDGMLWVASVLGRRLVQLDPRDGRVLSERGLELGVETPDDTTFGPGGTQYFTSLFTGKVGAITPDGKQRQVAQLPPGANPIAFTRDHARLFVGLCFFGDALYEVDPAGAREPRLVAEGLGTGCGANGMAFGQDGLLYAPQTFSGRLLRIDVDKGTHEILQEGYGPMFNGVAFQPNTEVLYGVAGQTVVRIDLEQGTHSVVATTKQVLAHLVFDKNGGLYVSVITTGEVIAVSPDGQLRHLRGDLLSMPRGLAMDGGGQHLFVANGSIILRVDAQTGSVADELPWVGLGANGLHLSDETLVGTSAGEGLVAGLDSNTGAKQFVRNDFKAPIDAVLLPDGDLVVAEAQGGRVVRSPKDTPGAYEVLTAGLGQPAGLLLTGGDLYVSDFVKGIVYQLMDDGKVLDPPLAVAEGLQGPEGLAWRSERLLVVESTAGRVSEIDLKTGSKTTLPFELQLGKAALAAFPPSPFYHGIAVSPGGSIFVSDNLGNRVLWSR